MSDRSWWVGVALITAVLLVHALVPRYEIRIEGVALVRIDRWTGQVELGSAKNLSWVTVRETQTARFEDIEKIEPASKTAEDVEDVSHPDPARTKAFWNRVEKLLASPPKPTR